MAKKSKIVRNEQRRAVVASYAERRNQLKAIIRSPVSTVQQRQAAQDELARQPRDASAVRLRNRDAVDGRPRGPESELVMGKKAKRSARTRGPARSESTSPRKNLRDGTAALPDGVAVNTDHLRAAVLAARSWRRP